MNPALKRGRFYDTANTILNQWDQEMCWSLYLAYFSNPFMEPMTFDEFRNLSGGQEKKGKPRQQTEVKGLSKQEAQELLQWSKRVLDGFVPPGKEGEMR